MKGKKHTATAVGARGGLHAKRQSAAPSCHLIFRVALQGSRGSTNQLGGDKQESVLCGCTEAWEHTFTPSDPVPRLKEAHVLLAAAQLLLWKGPHCWAGKGSRH